MGFFTGLVFGFGIGLGLMFACVYMMVRKSAQRIQKSADIKLLGSLNQDDIKKLCGEEPLWISFPQFERVKWLNKQLERLWPSVAAAASHVIKESVEPILDSYRPVGIKKLKFNKLFLGYVAPKIEGIRMQTLKEGQITMDLDFKWGGDPSIILGVHTLLGPVLPVQLKNFSFFATIRVIFQLCEEMPCISALTVAILAKPKPEIKYTLKVVGGSLTAVPGLSDMIRDLVESAITDQLQWPHRIVVPISPNPGDLSDLELKLQGQVTVTVIKAEKLKNMEMVGKSDPYVVLHVRPLWKFKTKTINNDLNPQWNELFTLAVEDQETQVLHFKVVDADIGSDKTLALVSYPLIRLVPGESVKLQLPLLASLDTDRVKDKMDRGSLLVELKYHAFSKEESEAAMEAEKKLLEHKKKLKDEGVLNSMTDAVGGAVGGVLGGGAKIAGGAVGLVGSGLVGGVQVVGGGAGKIAGGVGMLGSSLLKSGKAIGVNLTRNSSRSQSHRASNGSLK